VRALLSMSALLGAGEAAALTVYVDQTSTYRYVNASADTCVYANLSCGGAALPAGWFAYDFDDSSWYTGQAPFASGPGTIGDVGNVNGPFAPGATQPIPAPG